MSHYTVGQAVELADTIRILDDHSQPHTLPAGTHATVNQVDPGDGALNIRIPAIGGRTTTVLPDEIRPAPVATPSDRELNAIRAVNSMTDALAKALRREVTLALRYAAPERILEELDAAWGSGAHDAAAVTVICDAGWEYSDTHQQWVLSRQIGRAA